MFKHEKFFLRFSFFLILFVSFNPKRAYFACAFSLFSYLANIKSPLLHYSARPLRAFLRFLSDVRFYLI